jgi:hypothetical protein
VIDILSHIPVNSSINIVINKPVREKIAPNEFLLLFITSLNLHINIIIIDIINKIENIITIIRQAKPSFEACFSLTHNNPIIDAEKAIIDKTNIFISTHLDEKLLQQLQQQHKIKHIN